MSYEQPGRDIDPYSVSSVSGTLITCDSAAKEILLRLDQQRPGSDKFVIKNVDEGHLLIKTHALAWVQNELNIELEKNTYVQNKEL